METVYPQLSIRDYMAVVLKRVVLKGRIFVGILSIVNIEPSPVFVTENFL